MLKYIKIFIILIGLNCISYAQDYKIDDISIQTKKDNKHVMIFFHMTHCPYCEKMLRKTFKARNISKQVKKYFTFVDINKDDDGKVFYKDFQGTKSEFAKELKVNLYPTIIFLDNNKIVHRFKGYRNKNKFVEILKYITTKSYNSMDFETFLVELELNAND